MCFYFFYFFAICKASVDEICDLWIGVGNRFGREKRPKFLELCFCKAIKMRIFCKFILIRRNSFETSEKK